MIRNRAHGRQIERRRPGSDQDPGERGDDGDQDEDREDSKPETAERVPVRNGESA
ncbi:MAG: hypothetical protein M3077_05245 [Candidatus Dormibacteraeota bacterium]|nr:hypothetical protein [Candidatus Dormibacteraeota bacterium]